MLRHPSSSNNHPQMTTLLMDLGATQNQVLKALPANSELVKRMRKMEEGPSAKKSKVVSKTNKLMYMVTHTSVTIQYLCGNNSNYCVSSERQVKFIIQSSSDNTYSWGVDDCFELSDLDCIMTFSGRTYARRGRRRERRW